MYTQILRKVVVGPLGFAEHILGTNGIEPYRCTNTFDTLLDVRPFGYTCCIHLNI